MVLPLKINKSEYNENLLNQELSKVSTKMPRKIDF